jgi:hypothetical protein
MNRKLILVVAIQALIIVILFWLMVFYGKDEYEALTQESEEEIEVPNRITEKSGQTVISISAETQNQSEIKTSPLEATNYAENVLSYGNVLNIAELIQLRAQYLANTSENALISQSLAASKKEYERLYALNQDDKNIADKVVQTALIDVKNNEAKLSANLAASKNLADTMRQQWGSALTQMAIANNPNALLSQLLSNEAVLIQITLPFSAHEPEKNSKIQIAPTSALSQKITANYFAPAPTSVNGLQGKTYFYYAQAPFLRAGMPIKVLDFNQLSKPLSGVMIPNNAVVWHAGKPWVYHKINATDFIRLPINNDHEMEDGWFYQGQLKDNDEVVTSGAQLLLSEEFKSQITNENDD